MKSLRFLAVGLFVVCAVVASAPVQAQGWADDGSVVRLITSTDKVGIGTSTPGAALDVGGWTGMPGDVNGALATIGGAAGGDFFFGNAGAGVARMRMASNANQALLQWNVYYSTGFTYKSMAAAKPSYEIDFNSVADTITFKRYAPAAGALAPAANLVTISANGNLVAGGQISGASVVATYQDVAEWVPATNDLAPGTVVVLNPEKSNEVKASASAYDTMVAGVVSAQPGLILGVGDESKEMVATTGRVKVRVDASAGAISIGDLLVTSSKPGMAMKSQPISMQGRSFHQPGTIIGKALEPLAKGEGEILVLLSLQ